MSSAVCVSVLNYENVVETGSETDEDDRTLVSEENGLTNGGGGGAGGEDEEPGSPAGVPSLEASPRVAHALLSYRDQEASEGQQNHHHRWRLGDDTNGHLNGTGESSCLHLYSIYGAYISHNAPAYSHYNSFCNTQTEGSDFTGSGVYMITPDE